MEEKFGLLETRMGKILTSKQMKFFRKTAGVPQIVTTK